MKNSRFRYLFGSGTHYKPSKFLNFGEENQFWNQIFTNIFFRYQIFSIPIPVLFSGTKFFRYRFRDFFRYQIFPIPVPRLFSGTNFFRYRFRYHQKNEKFPVPGIPGTGTSHSAARPPKATAESGLFVGEPQWREAEEGRRRLGAACQQ